MTALLILGGTHFLGVALAEDALDRGWDVTVVHRGRCPAPAGAESVLVDRQVPGALRAALKDRSWDLSVDTWSGPSSAVTEACVTLRAVVHRTCFVSSRSVYVWPAPAGADESAPVVAADGEAQAEFGPRKRAGELAVLEDFGSHALIVRPGLILGPGERPGRLPWWLRRLAAGGEVVIPGPPCLGLQYVDARDLARWILDALPYQGGIIDAVSPPDFTTMGCLMEECLKVTGHRARVTWATPGEVAAAGVEAWTQLPLWLPPGPEHAAVHGAAGRMFREASLRPLGETVADTWRWLMTEANAAAEIGMDACMEARLRDVVRGGSPR